MSKTMTGADIAEAWHLARVYREVARDCAERIADADDIASIRAAAEWWTDAAEEAARAGRERLAKVAAERATFAALIAYAA